MAIKRNMISGIFVTLVVSVVAKILAVWLPFLGAEAIAMLIGIVLGNTVLNHDNFAPGMKWAEKYPIEIGIALMGLTITLKTIENLGLHGILFILIQMGLTIAIVLWLGGRLFKVSDKSAMLMGAGNAVCGSSAIAAVAPAIGATDDQRRTTVATVSLTGVVLLLLLPVVGPMLVGQNNLLLGALVGGVVQSVGQVVGTAALINPTVVTYATLFKMLRVILLTVVVLVFAKMAQRKDTTTAVKTKGVSIPWFVIAFLVFLLIVSFVKLPSIVTNSAHEIAGFFGVVNLAGIGLNLKVATIRKSGSKFMAYGLLTGVVQVVLAVILIKILF
ncbi:putative sulfate exporter family transporter [Leuconostoc holzapfelii]|uniref:Sulfate exporter family transporter n=1 Tax=Leuconostoc holzapfelii TaxID=434464 RepID=A0A846ZCC1_9LACO|nr:putative sulfate exporter family transporter [Leuconostoc holzapfelii]MCT8389024.1 putative sulfate exporter family transporter [Leuconostoc holzapfelii]NKZ18498.1 putative sulfate exporter family transporter [Leuconostoc holzapfelii]